MAIFKRLKILLETNDLFLEGLFDNHIDENSDTMDIIMAFYEASYKLTIVERNKSNSALPQRQLNIITKLNDIISKTSNILKKRFNPVFKAWLKNHALNDPSDWANARVNSDVDSPIDLFDAALNEYSKYAYIKNPPYLKLKMMLLI